MKCSVITRKNQCDRVMPCIILIRDSNMNNNNNLTVIFANYIELLYQLRC